MTCVKILLKWKVTIMNNYNERIELIKETQKKLLIIAKDRINIESYSFNNETKKLVEVLKYDSMVVKKYEAIVEAQKLIETYTEEIKKADSVEKIVKIRKNLNKCINKIKKEMKNRGIDESDYNSYSLETDKLRKSISQNIRFIKRENKINEIETLSNNCDNLNDEEKLRLKKLLKNELSYGKRNLGKIENAKNEVITLPTKPLDAISINNSEKEKNEVKKDEKKEEKKDSRYIKNTDNKDNTKKDITTCKYFRNKEKRRVPQTCKYFVNNNNPVKKENKKETKKDIHNHPMFRLSGAVPVKTYNDVENYLSEKIDLYNEKYDVIIPEGYSESKLKNIRIFARNLPTIIRNKGRIRLMMADSVMANNSRSDLIGFIEYNRDENSILNNVKKVIKGTPLIEQEEFYNVEHQKCIEWIINYCKNNNLNIVYKK